MKPRFPQSTSYSAAGKKLALLFGQSEENYNIRALPSKTVESEARVSSPENPEKIGSKMQLLAMSSLAFAVFFIFVVAVFYSY